MPIDPSILLTGRAPQGMSTTQFISAIDQIQQRREQGEIRRQAAEEARARAAEAAATRQREAQVQATLRDAVAFDPATGEPTVDWTKITGHLDPAVSFKVLDTINQSQTNAMQLRTAKMGLAEKSALYLGTVAAPPVQAGNYDKKLWDIAATTAYHEGAMSREQMQAALATTDPAEIQRATDAAIQKAQALAGKTPEAGFTLGPGQVRYDATGTQIAAGPDKPVSSAAVGSFEDYVVRTYGPTPTPAQIVEARKVYQQADDRPRITVNAGGGGGASDVKDIVQGMIDGRLPPQLPGRASPAYNAIMAEAQRRHFNLAGAATDWTATQKHIATLNGAQQTRLNQAVNALPEMLDKVETLAGQWKGTGAPILNRANLALAKNGVYGQKAAIVANQLESQIADVVADLGNVYMGGNSPTDHALSLAQKSLSADWSEPVLRQMVALAKQNVQIRRNSINSTGVQGASADNPYAPPAPAPPAAGKNPFRK